MRVLVIGSGFGGLAAAIRLRAAGHDVTVLERLDKPGGRAYVFEQDGFTFDAGPTIITAPALIDELFALGGHRTADYVHLAPIDPYYNVRFEDGSVFSYGSDRRDVERQVAAWSPDDVHGYRRFAAEAERILDAGFPLIDKPFTRIRDMLRVLPELVRLRADRPVARMVERNIRDSRLRQVFGFHPLLIGGNPFDTTSVYAMIHALERRWGVWFAMGGTGALVRGLVRLLEDMGGSVRLRAGVEEILVDGKTGRASGVRLANGELLAADIVVSNADIATTYTRLLPQAVLRRNRARRWRRTRYSMSLFVLYFGTKRRYDDVAHHEILMGPRYEALLSDIFRGRPLSRDFSLYLHRPTATDPSLAPDGCDAFYALAPVPNLRSPTDWAAAARPYRDAIVRYLEDRYLPGLSREIVTERAIDPRYFRDTLGAHLGSAFSVEPVLTQSAWFRPHNRSEDVPNLYFAGAGTHPGAGLPGVISSGKIVADLVAATI
ncbi:MAG TPA: phytoene desaturase [Gemmatimonadaceae bacterium]|nr:phytoene desaturase [Gemmatimonadaceae bacterium]